MNRWIFLFLTTIVSTSLHASNIEWQTNFDNALTSAKQQNKKILLWFSGSDWCGPGKRLNSEVFQKQAWIEYSNSTFVPVRADFPRWRYQPPEQVKANHNLAKKYGYKGCPTLVAIDPRNAMELFRTSGFKPDYIQHIKRLDAQAKGVNALDFVAHQSAWNACFSKLEIKEGDTYRNLGSDCGQCINHYWVGKAPSLQVRECQQRQQCELSEPLSDCLADPEMHIRP